MEPESAEWANKEPAIIYEDKDIVVINKPPGLPVHADGRHERATLVDWLLVTYPDVKEVGEQQTLPDGTIIERPGIVHRIDAATSGVMVIARTQKAFEKLKKQFRDREVKKVYRAFVYGPLKDERGIIDKPIGSARGGAGPRSARTPRGKMREAQTAYHVLAKNKETSYVEVFPKTGRTHQIRVHFSAIQHPVIGDPLYAPNRPKLLGFNRLALHALSLAFVHPNGKEVLFEAPLPADFAEAGANLN